jgi:hypothetical protein
VFKLAVQLVQATTSLAHYTWSHTQMLSISAQSPDHLATLFLYQYKQFNWGWPSACQQMWCPGRCWLSVSIYHAQGKDKRDTLYWSGHIRELAWSMEGTTKQIANTGCPRRNVRDFGRVFLMLNYTDITQNTYIQSWTVTEIMAIEMCGLLWCSRTVHRLWRHTRPVRVPRTAAW